MKNNFERPLYYGKDSKLVDIVCSELYYNSGLNNIVDSIKEAYTGKHRSRNIALTTALGVSIVSNAIGAHYANVHNYGIEGIDNTSFWSEVLPHAVISGTTFILSSKYIDKITLKQSLSELSKLAVVSTAITLLLYKPARDYLSDCYMATGTIPAFATPKAQGVLFPFYAISVKYGMLGEEILEKYIKQVWKK